MAAIDIGDCTVTNKSVGVGVNEIKIVTPATADDGDTIDASDYLVGGDVISASCQATTDGWLPVAAISTAGNITLPGSTDDEARTVRILLEYNI